MIQRDPSLPLYQNQSALQCPVPKHVPQHWMYSCDCQSSYVHMGTVSNPSAPVITKERVFSSSEPLLD